MTKDEITANLNLANKQLDIRLDRLKREYQMNAPKTIINHELELIQEAGERIQKFTLELRKV